MGKDIKISIIDILTNSKLYKLKKGLENYKAIYIRYVMAKYKNDSNYSITESDFNSFFEIISMNCYKDYNDTKFENLLDLDIDLIIRRRIYRVASYYEIFKTYKGQISRDFLTLIRDLNVRDEFKNDVIDININ